MKCINGEDSIVYRNDVALAGEDLKELYDDAGWVAYTKDLPCLLEAIEHSLLVITAWDRDRLVGMIRIVGDGRSILYIQDILVLSTYRRSRIGTNLVKQVLAEFNTVRQKVLLTDDTPQIRAFYESLGFFSCDRGELVAFVKFG